MLWKQQQIKPELVFESIYGVWHQFLKKVLFGLRQMLKKQLTEQEIPKHWVCALPRSP